MPIRLPRTHTIPSGVDAASAPPLAAEAPVELLSIAQAAAFAGVAPVSVRRWVRQGMLPVYRAGVQIRVDRADLIRFMRR